MSFLVKISQDPSCRCICKHGFWYLLLEWSVFRCFLLLTPVLQGDFFHGIFKVLRRTTCYLRKPLLMFVSASLPSILVETGSICCPSRFLRLISHKHPSAHMHNSTNWPYMRMRSKGLRENDVKILFCVPYHDNSWLIYIGRQRYVGVRSHRITISRSVKEPSC